MTHTIPLIRGRLVGEVIEYRTSTHEDGPLCGHLPLDTLHLVTSPGASPALVFALRTAAGAWWAARGSTLRAWSGGPLRTIALGRTKR